MIEMRWYVPVVGEKVLQYRQKVDINVYAGAPFPGTSFTPNMQWSDWKTVMIESEPDPAYP
jgi:hypothetical protein